MQARYLDTLIDRQLHATRVHDGHPVQRNKERMGVVH